MRIYNPIPAARSRLRLILDFARQKGLPVDNVWARGAMILSTVIIACGLILLIIGLAATSPQSSKAQPSAAKSKSRNKQASKPTSQQPQPPSASLPTATTSPSSSSAASNPSSILDLANWKLTLPTKASGSNSPNEIDQPALSTFSENPYFYVNNARTGVVFQAPVGGATTSNSDYPRSELREMSNGGSQEASWSDTSGTHSMTITEAITHLPVARPQVVAGQIHGPSEYVILIRLNGSTLFVEDNGKNIGTLNASYSLGTTFTVKVIASNGYIQVFYNGVQKTNYAQSGSGYYFKAGCYTQSNPSDGDSPEAYGQVVIYGLQVTHS